MFELNFPELNILTERQLDKIHNATLEVLEKTGVVFKHPKALQVFHEAGAQVDFKEERVRMPTHLVEEALRKAPTRFVWNARNPKKSVKFQKGRIHFETVSTPSFIFDLETGLKRNATFQDCMNVSKIMDYLKYADSCYCSMKPLDVPDVAADAYMVLAQIKNSDKCLRGRERGTAIAEDSMKMMSILLGSEEELKKKPMLVCIPNPSSPLIWDKTMIEGVMVFAENGQIPIPSSEILSGAIGPVTLAGTMVQNNAEILSMLTFLQLFNPGTPVIYGTVSAALDMKTAMMRIGGPELGIMQVGLSQLARRYKLPLRGTCGNTDSKTLDIQAGYEAGFNLVLAVLSGVDLVTYAFGSMEFTATLCYEKIITDHEFLGMVERLVRGISVSDETLGVDLIDEVGPGGHFLAKKHTRRHHSREHFIPRLFDTRPYETWAASDTKDIRMRAREEVKRILREHQPPPLDKGVEKELEEYVRMVEKRGR